MISNDSIQRFGQSEEEKVARALGALTGIRVFRNVYVPCGHGLTAEIDLVLLSPKGLFLFEVKGYGGTITGSNQRYEWTQVYRHEGKQKKRKFYNPIKQQEAHAKALVRWLRTPLSTLHSYIVFSDRARLKKIPPNTGTITILQTPAVYNAVKHRLINRPVVFSENDLVRMGESLQRASRPSDKIIQRHIAQAQAAHDRRKKQNRR